MCGVAGIISKRIEAEHFHKIQKMLDKQEHRGPDFQYYRKLDECVMFGHNRLSIIDLSKEASQPFSSNDSRYSIVFNGEIYNYIELKKELKHYYDFKTTSDTEVLLAAYTYWGELALEKLIGMFAFAIYDKEKQEVFLARDRFGVKPLYYAFDEEGSFYFASEIKTLHSAGICKRNNEKLLASYLINGAYQHKNQTFWDNIYQLESGHYVTFSPRKIPFTIKNRQWYYFVNNINRLRHDINYKNRSKEEHLSQYKSLLEDSIRLRFRSDVPVGFNISGGLDSSTLLGAVHKFLPSDTVKAYTFYCNDERYDELPWVQKLIAETNKALESVLLKIEEVPQIAQQVSYFQDEPFGGIPTLAYSKIFKSARENGTIVLLDGQGMDEAWAGYDYYHKGNNKIVQGVNTSPFKPKVLTNEFKDQAFKIEYPKPFEEELLNQQYRDLFFTKIPRALRFNDRISMMHSTELREPFLDHRMVEYVFAFPMNMKKQNGQVKWALRQLANEYLKNEIILAPKRPLQTPQREWLSGQLKDWIMIQIEKSIKTGWFRKKELNKELEVFFNGNNDNSFFLWQWVSIGMLSDI